MSGGVKSLPIAGARATGIAESDCGALGGRTKSDTTNNNKTERQASDFRETGLGLSRDFMQISNFEKVNSSKTTLTTEVLLERLYRTRSTSNY